MGFADYGNLDVNNVRGAIKRSINCNITCLKSPKCILSHNKMGIIAQSRLFIERCINRCFLTLSYLQWIGQYTKPSRDNTLEMSST